MRFSPLKQNLIAPITPHLYLEEFAGIYQYLLNQKKIQYVTMEHQGGKRDSKSQFLPS